MTFAAACDDYLANQGADRRLKPTTLRDHASIIEAHLVPVFGDGRRVRHGWYPLAVAQAG